MGARRALGLALVAALVAALVSACASRPVRVRIPEGEDYVFPISAAGALKPQEVRALDRAWANVLSGSAAAAERQFLKLALQHPGLPAPETGVAFARLRGGRVAAAGHGFQAVLNRHPAYVPALVGAATSARRLGDAEGALGLLRRAEAASPQDPVVRRRLAEVKLQITERRMAAARAAAETGQTEQATLEYRWALEAAPEVGGVRVELANLFVAGGQIPEAIATLEADPAEDRQVLLRLGELLSETGERARALDAYRRILTRDPKDGDALAKALDLRRTIELLQMPEEYRRIESAARITRADLAALLSVKVTALSRLPAGEGEPQVAIDISGSWAREHIVRLLAFEIMDLYPNHTFQPAAIVRRGELARAVGRILDLARWPVSTALPLTDMSYNNLFYDAAVRAVGAGLMDLTPGGAFEGWRPVSGRDAVDVIEGLTRLVGP